MLPRVRSLQALMGGDSEYIAHTGSENIPTGPWLEGPPGTKGWG